MTLSPINLSVSQWVLWQWKLKPTKLYSKSWINTKSIKTQLIHSKMSFAFKFPSIIYFQFKSGFYWFLIIRDLRIFHKWWETNGLSISKVPKFSDTVFSCFFCKSAQNKFCFLWILSLIWNYEYLINISDFRRICGNIKTHE